MPISDKGQKYTYKDYLTWPEDERWELIDGIAYLQSAPTWQHKTISMELATQFANYLRGKSFRVFTAPFDLRLPDKNEEDEDTQNILQPDIVVICDKSGLKGTGYYGAPELIIEITSPSTSRMDRLLKFNKYEKAGVKEYWIVEPEGKFVSVFILQENARYGRPELYSEKDKIKVSVFPDLETDLEPVFDQI